jgi:hypothetical protein
MGYDFSAGKHTFTLGDKVGIGASPVTDVLEVTGNIAVTGTVDGIDISTIGNRNTANGYAGTDANNYIILARFQPITTIASPYNITANDYTIVCGAATTVTLPTAVGIPGRIYNIKNMSSGIVTVATTSSQTIDGSTTRLISTNNETITVQSDNVNWVII